MHKVRINQGRSIPWTFRLAGTAFVIVLVVNVFKIQPESVAILLAIVVSMALPMLWFSFRILTIDHDHKTLQQGIWIMGHKTGKKKKYDSIEKIFINKVKTSLRMQSYQTGGVHTHQGMEYRAYVKLDDGQKFFLISHKNEEKLKEKVDEIARKLGVQGVVNR